MLKDGTELSGTLVHYYDQTFTLVLDSGDTLKLGPEDLAKLVFDQDVVVTKKNSESKTSTKIRSKSIREKSDQGPFSTPENTFYRWKKSLLKGDINGMADCFIMSATTLMRNKLQEMSKKERRKMRRDAKKTKFLVGIVDIEGDRATLPITRVYKGNRQLETLKFLQENGDWKLIPN